MESLEAVCVFIVPLLLVFPFYILGYLTEDMGNYILYTLYIACSILLTKYNGRSWAEMGLTRHGLSSSLGNSLALVAAFSAARFLGAGLKLSPTAQSMEAVAYNLLYWSLSGLGQEILFRGLILFSFNRWKGGNAALLVSTVLFGLVHFQRYSAFGVVLVGALGACWGWIALRSKNIFGPIIAHSLFNFLFAFLLIS